MENAFQLLAGIVHIRGRIPVCVCLACDRAVRRLVRFRKDRVPAGRGPGPFPIRIIRERIEKPVMANGRQTVLLILIRDGRLMAAAVPVRDGFCSLRGPVPVIIRIGDRPPFRIRSPGEQPPGQAFRSSMHRKKFRPSRIRNRRSTRWGHSRSGSRPQSFRSGSGYILRRFLPLPTGHRQTRPSRWHR